ncbi:MAG: 50S ribosomal protein L2 [Patescibacteria group bacterium]
MDLKQYKPFTPSRRHITGINYRRFLSGKKAEKSLTGGFRRAAGRNNKGRITVYHKGGGHKRLWRMVDFKFDKKDIPGRIAGIEYDPNRSAFIALVFFRDGEKRYMVVPDGLTVGKEIMISEKADIVPGNRLPLKNIPVGTPVYNIELKPKTEARLVRSAGSSAVVLAHDEGKTQIKLPSREIRKIDSFSWASIGQVSNPQHNLTVIGKAGRSRWLGIRPTVRGSAMNPCDHPYGGGEGRALRGTRRPKNRWGKGTRGVKTRKVKKYSDIFILQRREKKKRR